MAGLGDETQGAVHLAYDPLAIVDAEAGSDPRKVAEPDQDPLGAMAALAEQNERSDRTFSLRTVHSACP